MTDTTSIFSELNSDEGSVDVFNVVSATFVVLYLIVLAIFGGTEPFNFNEILASAIYFFLIAGGLLIAFLGQRYGNIFTSETHTTTSASLYVIFTLIPFFVITGSLLGAGEITLFGDSFSSFTANLEPYHKAIFIVNIAPISETLIAVAGVFALTGFMVERNYHKRLPGGGFTVATITTIPIAIAFAFIHDSEAARISGEFWIRAFLVMFFSMFIIFAEEITERDYLPFAAIAAVAIAVHRAFNIISYGGYQQYFADIMSAPMPHLTLSYLWLIYDLIWVGIFAWAIGKTIVHIIDPDAEFAPIKHTYQLFNRRRS